MIVEMSVCARASECLAIVLAASVIGIACDIKIYFHVKTNDLGDDATSNDALLMPNQYNS